MGVPLERDQLDDISEGLAKNDDGKIYYGCDAKLKFELKIGLSSNRSLVLFLVMF